MPVFDWAESPGTSVEIKPRTVETVFGDGYVSATPDGLNASVEEWDVNIDAAGPEAAAEIDTFIRPGLGFAIFDWTPPGRTAPQKYCCTAYTRSLGAMYGEFNIRLRFTQRFQP